MEMWWGDIFFECDELQHCSYSISDECKRMAALWQFERQRHPYRRLHIVRFNPNAYKQDGIVVKPNVEERTATISASLAYVPDTDFVITYLYYRKLGGHPAITMHPEYSLKEYVRTV